MNKKYFSKKRCLIKAPYKVHAKRVTLIKGARIFSDTGSNTCKVLKITFWG
ncbi:hypothetical protein SAMN04487851_11720 [Prevotella sp. tc2-28]|nr:hypothetical protein SAMN04487851_11720 [Prevotella sp. tc2-28]